MGDLVQEICIPQDTLKLEKVSPLTDGEWTIKEVSVPLGVEIMQFSCLPVLQEHAEAEVDFVGMLLFLVDGIHLGHQVLEVEIVGQWKVVCLLHKVIPVVVSQDYMTMSVICITQLDIPHFSFLIQPWGLVLPLIWGLL